MAPSADVVPFPYSRAARPARLPREQRLASIIATQYDILTSGIDLEHVLAVIVDKAQRLTNAHGAVVELLEGDSLVYRATSGTVAPHLGQRVPAAQSLAGACLAAGTAMRCDDSETDARVNVAQCRTIHARSMLAVPLVHERRIGVLKVLSPAVAAFDDEDVETVQLTAGIISAALLRAAELSARQQLLEERERNARMMEEQTAMLRVMFDHGPQLVGILQAEGAVLRYVTANPAVSSFFGIPAERIAGRTSAELGSPAETTRVWLDVLAEAARTGLTQRFEYTRGSDRDARVLACAATMLPGRANEKHARFAFVATEVTDRLRMRDQMAFSERMACVGRLAAGVAHEVNNPLAYASSNLQFVGQELETEKLEGALLDEVRAAIADASNGVERVVHIVRDLQTFVRSNDELNGLVDLQHLAERCLTLTHNETKHRTQLVTDFGHTPLVNGNEGQLGQVMVQLVVNAVHALEGRPPERNQIVVRTGVAPDGRAVLEVQDNGVGIAADSQQRIFEPFFTTRPIGSAIGMGLTVCRNVVEAHGGEILVSSLPGVGATFRVLLPAAK
ncbi:MAG: ATP-binding protein [Myxococcaceae bacterium]